MGGLFDSLKAVRADMEINKVLSIYDVSLDFYVKGNIVTAS